MAKKPTVSKGCEACRRMKVKCDEAKPWCGRCTKAGRTCPGYRELSIFRPAKTIVRSRHSSRAPHIALDEPLTYSFTSIRDPGRLPSTNWEQHAIAYFFSNYVCAPVAHGNGHLDYLPETFTRDSHVDYFRNSLMAVALSSIANVSVIMTLQHKAGHLYGQALSSINRTLRRQCDEKDCELLMLSIFLLQKYEIINGIRVFPDAHSRGLCTLFQMRCSKPMRDATPSSRGVLQTISRRMHVGVLDDGNRQFVEQQMSKYLIEEHRYQTILWALLREVATTCRAMNAAAAGLVERNFRQFEDTLRDALDLNERLCAWKDAVPEAWHYKKLEPSAVACPESDLYAFQSITHAAPWLVFWCSRMDLLRCIQHCAERTTDLDIHSDAASPEMLLKVRQDSHGVVGDICAASPFLMGELDKDGKLTAGSQDQGKAIGPFFLLRCLHDTLRVDGLPASQQAWILDCLQSIGHRRGIKMALRCREQFLMMPGSAELVCP